MNLNYGIKKKVIAISGSKGVLGKKFISKFNKYSYQLIDFNICNSKKLEKWIKTKKFDAFIHLAAIVPLKEVKKNKRWNNQFLFFEPNKKITPSWFGLPILINRKINYKRKKFVEHLNRSKIENRPIVSGNFLKQPAIKLYKLNTKGSFKNADLVQKSGFLLDYTLKNFHNLKLTILLKSYLI
jgi:hypothetical protein